MGRRLLALTVISGILYIIKEVLPESLIEPGAIATLSFGFLILTSYIIAAVLARVGLPKITGYIVAGMLFGPSILGFMSNDVLSDLKLVDDLALTFIAFAAGGELRMAMLKERKRSIGSTLVCLIIIVLLGVTFSIVALRSFFPFTVGRPFIEALAIASILGVIAVARSPSSAIAIISETKASGRFTEMVLGVTVAADVLTIFLFAIVLSLAELALTPGKAFDFVFLIGIGSEVLFSLIIGAALGQIISFYLKSIKANFTVFILGVAFLVTKFSGAFGVWLDGEFGVHFHLEPMLICLTAGFFIQNVSKLGDSFLKVIDRSSLPIYAVFFSISGASLRLEALEETWLWALLLVVLRLVFVNMGTYLGGWLAKDPPIFQKASGLSFVTQAGVSLGLAKLVAEKFPDIGEGLATLVVATIAINQVIGPVTFKKALSLVGETKQARLAKLLKG